MSATEAKRALASAVSEFAGTGDEEDAVYTFTKRRATPEAQTTVVASLLPFSLGTPASSPGKRFQAGNVLWILMRRGYITRPALKEGCLALLRALPAEVEDCPMAPLMVAEGLAPLVLRGAATTSELAAWAKDVADGSEFCADDAVEWLPLGVFLAALVDALATCAREGNVPPYAERGLDEEAARKIAEEHYFLAGSPPATVAISFAIPDPASSVASQSDSAGAILAKRSKARNGGEWVKRVMDMGLMAGAVAEPLKSGDPDAAASALAKAAAFRGTAFARCVLLQCLAEVKDRQKLKRSVPTLRSLVAEAGDEAELVACMAPVADVCIRYANLNTPLHQLVTRMRKMLAKQGMLEGVTWPQVLEALDRVHASHQGLPYRDEFKKALADGTL